MVGGNLNGCYNTRVADLRYALLSTSLTLPFNLPFTEIYLCAAHNIGFNKNGLMRRFSKLGCR